MLCTALLKEAGHWITVRRLALPSTASSKAKDCLAIINTNGAYTQIRHFLC
jgi:hypothetical protein